MNIFHRNIYMYLEYCGVFSPSNTGKNKMDMDYRGIVGSEL